MAIYHLSAQIISRKAGRSSTAAAAYRAGERIVDELTGEIHDYTRKGGVSHTEIVMPSGSDWTPTRSQLWNAVEAKNKRADSQVAREFLVALPDELDQNQRRELAMAFARELADKYQIAVDVAVHAPGKEGDQRNHHAHILTSTNKVQGHGFGNKARELDFVAHNMAGKVGQANEIDLVRERWEQLANQALEMAGQEARIDRRSLAEQGIYDRLPGPHLGPAATAIKRRGGVSTIEERAKEQAAQFLAEVQAQVALQRAAERDVAELEAELALLKLQALPLADQRQHWEQVAEERRAEIEDLTKRRTELQSIYNRAQRRELVEDAHRKAPGLAKAAKAATARAEALRAELEATSWWQPFKRARLERELPEAQERAERLQAEAKAAQGMASLPIKEKVEAAMAELDRQIEPGQDQYHDALMELHQVKTQEAAQKAREEAIAKQARVEAEREEGRRLAAEIEANLGKWREKKPQQQRERAQDRDDGPTLGR